jgi:hypothetical protein
MMVKDLWRQISDVARLIPIEKAAQGHGDMTGIAIHRPADEELDVAHEPIIRGWPIPRFLAWMQTFLLAFARV